MNSGLRGARIGLIERRHPPGYRGALVNRLVPLLREEGAQVDLVHAEHGLHRLDTPPPWDLAVLKSGSAAALHLAAAAESWGIPSVNRSEATRLAQDKLASATILQRAGSPIAPAHLAWLSPASVASGALSSRSTDEEEQSSRSDDRRVSSARCAERLDAIADRPLVVKSARGSRGAGLWTAEAGELRRLAARLPQGPYLLMERIPHAGDDLKVYVAGGWMAAIERPFPAESLSAKLGRPARLPENVAAVSREAGRLLGLSCFGCDFVEGLGGWTLVDVNAFPGYKGVERAPEALVAEISRAAEEARR
jgi:ribosomal protein S6--L-glutamate ligase